MKKIAIIPARSGSKGLPNKNILNLCGKPLVAWSIEAAVKSKCFDRIIVSTDSVEYGNISKSYGAEVVYRSKEASSDTASTYDAVKELFEKEDLSEYDYFMILQPTSPLRTEEHIIESIKIFEQNYENRDTLVSVSEAHKPTVLIREIDNDFSLRNFDIDYSNYSRQQYHEYESNGAIFISKIDHYLKVKHFYGKTGTAYVMDKEAALDIDDDIDFELANLMMNKRLKETKLKETILERINEKSSVFENEEIDNKTISLIGHSQIDKWNIDYLKDYKVINYGINGISSFEYDEYILSANKLKCFSDIYVVMHGTNDVITNHSNTDISNSINKTIKYIKDRNKDAKILFLSCAHVNGRLDRNNKKIDELNEYLHSNLCKDVKWIDTKFLDDEFGNLSMDYTIDGLHLSEKGYKLLENKIEEILDNE